VANSEGEKRARVPGTSRISAKHREWLAGYLFVLPDAAGLMLFIGLPAAMALFVSIYSFDAFGSFTYVGAAHYRRMLLDPLFWKSLRVTAVFAAVLVPLLYVAGLGLALLVQRTNRYNAIMRSMLFAPQMVSLVVIGLVWQLLVVDKIGSVPRMLTAVGLEPVSFLGDPRFALLTVILVCVWFLMGFYMLVFLGGLHDIPKEYYEAAQLDGAGPVARFWYITLPLLRPTSFFVLLVSTVSAVAGAHAFDLVYVMTRGGPANATLLLISYIFQQAFQFGDFGYASAMSAVLVAMLAALSALSFLVTRGGRFQHA
jgi:multiple sugar transport system permease protein